MPLIINPYAMGNPADVGDPSAPHAYWRILYITNNGNASFVGMGRLEFYTNFGRVNLCVGGTPIANAGGVSGNVIASAFDNDVNTQWAENKISGNWIGYQMASPVIVRGCHMRDRGASQNALMPNNFKVQYSDDGSNWFDRFTVAAADFVTPGNFTGKWFWHPSYGSGHVGSPILPARYWRVQCMYHAADTFSCAEEKLVIVPAGASVATGGTAIFSTQTFGAAANAFDANTTTFWAPDNVQGSYLGYDFGAANLKAIAEMRWKSRSAGVPLQNPVRACVAFSSDGTNWSSAWEAYDGVTWTDGMEKTFTDPEYHP